jgi:multidrug efflux pump subunit AcrA (membrane-fusion protein)
MSRQAIWALLIVAGAALVAAALVLLRPEPAEQEEVAAVPLVQVADYRVSAGAIEIYGSGTVQPREEVTLGAEVAGRLVYVNPSFVEGSPVAAGALLFRIEAADYQNRVRSARADIAAQDVAVLQAREEMAIATAELERFAARETSRSALDASIDDNDYAARILPPERLARNAAPPASGSQSNVLATREPQLRSAEAARERARAQLADARLALGRTQVRAPFSGIVRSETAAVGTLVQPGQALGSIVASSSYEVSISMTEEQAALIPSLFAAGRTRIPARVMLDFGSATYGWDAYVDRVDPILDPETRMLTVFLRVPDPTRGGERGDGAAGEGADTAAAPPLLLGSFVSAAITGGSGRPFARIPLAGLRADDEVWLLREGKLAIVPVEVLQQTDDFAYVAAPALGEGGQVIVSGLRTPVNGMALRRAAESRP